MPLSAKLTAKAERRKRRKAAKAAAASVEPTNATEAPEPPSAPDTSPEMEVEPAGQRPTRRRSRQVRLLGDVERGARRLRSLLPSIITTAATVGAFARALRGGVLT